MIDLAKELHRLDKAAYSTTPWEELTTNQCNGYRTLADGLEAEFVVKKKTDGAYLIPKDNMSKEQWKKFQEWAKDRPGVGFLFERFTFLFTPNSIGMVVQVRDNVTKETIDLTEYDLW